MRFLYHKIGEKRYEMEENTMKKKLSIVLLSLVMAFNTCGIVGYADDGITVTLNGDKIDFDVQPQLINDRTMVPLRKIFEAMGAYVDWYGDTQTVVATKDDKVVTAKIDDTKLYINDEVKTLDVPPMIIDGRTLVPARFVAESFGANVDWDGATQTVVIMTKWFEGQPIPYYSKFSSIPDFGLITGVPGTEVNSDSKGAMYEYDIVDVNTNDGMQSYLNVMRNLGFNVKVWDEILTCEKNGTYVDISYMGYNVYVVITLPNEETIAVDSFIQGFEAAEFSKYNSPASENGLGGTKIYFQGTIEKVEITKLDAPADMIVGIIKDSNNHEWLCSLNMTSFADKKEYEELIGEPVVVCGVYQGYSSVAKMPAFELYKLLSVNTNETKDGIAIWTE